MSMLISLADMKTKLGIATTDHDVFLTAQITLVSEAVEMYCRRVFASTEYTETFYPEDFRQARTNTFRTFMYPIIEVDSIIYDTDYELEAADYRIHKPTGMITPTLTGFSFGSELIMTYTAGYAVVPVIIQDVVASIVTERFNKNQAGVELSFGSDVQRISIPGTISIDFDYSLQNNDRKTPFGVILGNYLNVLDYFRSDRAVIGPDRLRYVE